MTDLPVFPPLDGSITVLPGLVDFHAEHNAQRPWAKLAHPDGTGAISVSFAEYARATHRVAHLFRPGRAGSDGEVVAVLAHCDTLLYLALLPGLVRAGIIPLPMSPRLPAVAITALLEKTSCHRIISQPSFSDTIGSVQQELSSRGHQLLVESLPDVYSIFSSLPGRDSLPEVEPYPPCTRTTEQEDIVMYLLSSGSTSYVPKPLPQRQATVLQWCKSSCLVEAQHRGIAWGSFVPLPFHTLGVYMIMYAPLVSGHPVGIYYPRSPELPPTPTPKNVLEACKATDSSGVAVTPAFLEAWAQSDEDIQYLATLKTVIFAGGLLSDKNGAKLVKAGVKLYAVYGGTEFGAHTPILDSDDSRGSDAPVKTSADWAWMQFPDSVKPRWIPQGDDTFELEFITCDTHWPAIENLEDVRGYATNDLWVPHPSKPGLWKIIGRKDDVLCLSSGENVFAVPQENTVVSNGMVMGAVMFGEERSYCGILVELKPEFAINPSDTNAVSELRDKLWPIVREANDKAYVSARIAKPMILFTNPAKPLPRAPKGTVVRKRSLELYAPEIDHLYISVEASATGSDFTPPTSWAAEDVASWLGAYIHSTSDDPLQVNPAQDRFDSLYVHLLYKRITAAFERDAETRDLAEEFTEETVLKHPTVHGLADAVAEFVVHGKRATRSAL